MSKRHQVSVNGTSFSARSGQLILDAALLSGVDLPHDCRAGRCGSCIARVVRGVTLGGETLQPGMVHTCQARVFSGLELTVEPLPPVRVVRASVVELVDVARDVVEVVMQPEEPVGYLPGQYCRFTFRGFPPRAYSPTAPIDRRWGGRELRLNVKRVRDGRVSNALGEQIRPGHRVAIEGPFGHAFFRPGQQGRLVLVAGGTGFAPIWSIATAALTENPLREIVLIAGVKSLTSCYMVSALDHAIMFPNVEVIIGCEQPHPAIPELQLGPPSDHLPALRPSDIVYAAGAPKMVSTVAAEASAVHCQFYCDPFEPTFTAADNWLTKAANWLSAAS